MYSLFLPALALFATGALSSQSCRAVPDDADWPSDSAWQSLNRQVNGRLIQTSPIAEACYPGSAQDLADCDYITNQWAVEDFQTSHALGRVLPYNVTCPPVNYTAGEAPSTSCILGINPVYAVNATTREEINATVQFARENNVRLVTTGTGHDLLGRSDGFGSLELWLRYYRNNITFQPTYAGCDASSWEGSAIHIDGVYQWRDAAAVARANNVFVATGGTPSVGAIGGWSQGGGHGPATNYVGWGVDQILEADVLLANGQIVTASACENSDLYRSLRGGGPGYGVVLSMTVKAHPNVPVVTAHHLNITPVAATQNTSTMLDAIAVVLQNVPDLTESGVGGYAYWYNNYPTVIVANSTSGYTHGVWTIGQNETAARAALDPVVEQLQQRYNSTLSIQSSYTTYPDYWSFYYAEMGLDAPEGKTTIMSSRAINRDHITDPAGVRSAVQNISTAASGQYNANCILFVGNGPVPAQGDDPNAGYNPVWREAAFGLVNIRVVPLDTPNEERYAIEDDMLRKTSFMESFAPATGAYMNEADRRDPNYVQNFYGVNYRDHLATKHKYDPNNLFYCPTCVGAEAFVELPDGPLCAASSESGY